MLLPYRFEIDRIRYPWATIALVGLNVAVFAATGLRIEALAPRIGFTPEFPAPHGLVASMFLHANLLHLAGNLYFLYIFGAALEQRFAPGWLAGLYLALGVAASLVDAALAPAILGDIPRIGASGAVSGLLGLAAVLYAATPVESLWLAGNFSIIRVQLPGAAVVIVWFIYQVFLAVLAPGWIPGVAHWAHVGGAAAGMAVGAAVLWRERRPIPESRPTAAGLAAAGRWVESLSMLLREAEPDWVPAARCFVRLGRSRPALECLRRHIEAGGSDPAALAEAARILEKVMKDPGAATAFRRAAGT